MTARLADPARSRIVLIGTPAHREAGLPDVPEVANNVADLAAVFTDPELGGIETDHCVTASPTVGLDELGEVLHGAAAQAEDLFLIYYSGHGLLDRRGQLHLALSGTHPDRLGFTALPYETLRAVCLDSDAASKVVILDSCFSGRAIGKTLAEEAQQVLGQLEVDGTYTLTSASGSSSARVLPGERHTAFTGRLLQLLRDGDPSCGPVVSIGEVYRRLRSQLRAEGLPEPQQVGTATAELLGLVRNRRPAAPAAPVLPDDVREGLESRYPKIRLWAVNELGTWLPSEDAALVHLARLTLQRVAEHDNPTVAGAARSYLAAFDPILETVVVSPTAPAATAPVGFSQEPDPVWSGSTLPEVRTEDPWQALVLGSVMPGEVTKLMPFGVYVRLRDGVEGLVPLSELADGEVTSPDQIVQVGDEVTVKIIDVDAVREGVWLSLKQAGAGLTGDPEARRIPDAVARIAEGIPISYPYLRSISLAVAARAWVPVDPAEALRILVEAERLTDTIEDDPLRRAAALADLLPVWALVKPGEGLGRIAGKAERAVDSFGGAYRQHGLVEVVRAWAAVDMTEAERVAGTLDGDHRSAALAIVAGAHARANPAYAESIASMIDNRFRRLSVLEDVVRGWAAVDRGEARRTAADAERVARSFKDKYDRTKALVPVVRAWAHVDHDAAQRIAYEIECTAANVTASYGESALQYAAQAYAAVVPAYAEQIANAIGDKLSCIVVLAEAARAWLAMNPKQTRRIVARIERIAGTVDGIGFKAAAVMLTAETWATVDFTEALRVTAEIGDHNPLVTAETLRSLAKYLPGPAQ